MIRYIGNILKDQIEDLAFVDKIAGVVKPLRYKNKEGIIQTFPVDCQISLNDCNKNKRYLDLVPDNSKKSVIYFEDVGLRPVSQNGTILKMNAQLNLIGWLNLQKLGVNGCSYSAMAIGAILKKLSIPQFNVVDNPKLQYVSIKFLGQQPQSVNPFEKYSYDDTVNQFLMYPYDYFMLSFEIDFQFDTRCVNLETFEETNCLKK